MHGYGGKIIYADLTTRTARIGQLTVPQTRAYLGGSGFGAMLLLENVPGGADPLGPDNAVIMAPGALVATAVPTASKSVFTAKSPLTLGFTESVLGGGIGAALKFAGFDALVVRGLAAEPVYIYIDNDNVEFRSAGQIWGMDTYAAPEAVIRDISGKRIDRSIVVACIGIGGEKLVRYAGIDCEHRQAGRGGIGAVLGSKKCKAIAIRGTGKITIADPKQLLALSAKWYHAMKGSAADIEDANYGTGEFLEWMNSERGTFPTRNWQESVFAERNRIDPYHWAPLYSKKGKACYSCIKPCGHLVMIDEGPYQGTMLDGMEYELLYALGSNVGNSNIEALAKAHELVDRFGIDGISTGASIGFAMECYEKGLLTKKDTYDLDLKFGNEQALIELINAIAERRKGLGDILADGVRLASKRIGKYSRRFAIHVKGMEPPAYDVRGIKGLGLAFMTSPRGACHLRSCAYALELTGKFWKYSNVDRFSAENKGEMIANLENLMAVYDALGICKFQRGFYLLEHIPELIKAVTGMGITVEELLRAGERIHTLKKLFNTREGFRRKDDMLPVRLMSEPIKSGVAEGQYIKPEEAEAMLMQYYRSRGWTKGGKPTKKKLRMLGLKVNIY